MHNDFGSPQDLESIVNHNLLIIDSHKLPNNIKAYSVIQALEEGIINLDNLFYSRELSSATRLISATTH